MSAKLRERYNITHFYFHRPNRVNLLRVHNPEQYGDRIDRFTLRAAERTGKTISGIELGALGTLTLRVVQPVFDGEMLIGYLELGKEIEDIIMDIHRQETMGQDAQDQKKAAGNHGSRPLPYLPVQQQDNGYKRCRYFYRVSRTIVEKGNRQRTEGLGSPIPEMDDKAVCPACQSPGPG